MQESEEVVYALLDGRLLHLRAVVSESFLALFGSIS